MINELRIKIFLSLCSTLNFTETANNLFLTQQAVSRHISQLEDDLGYKLLERNTHKTLLTPAGERTRDFFSSIIPQINDFINYERELQTFSRNTIYVGYTNWVNYGMAIAAAQDEFHRNYPDTFLFPEQQPPDMLQKQLLAGTQDIIMLLKRFFTIKESVRVTSLTKVPICLIMNKIIYESDEYKTLEDYSSLPLLINRFQHETPNDTLRRARKECDNVGLSNHDIRIFPNRDSVYFAVEVNEGIAIGGATGKLPDDVMSIPTKYKDTLIAVCKNDPGKETEDYLRILRDKYRKYPICK